MSKQDIDKHLEEKNKAEVETSVDAENKRDPKNSSDCIESEKDSCAGVGKESSAEPEIDSIDKKPEESPEKIGTPLLIRLSKILLISIFTVSVVTAAGSVAFISYLDHFASTPAKEIGSSTSTDIDRVSGTEKSDLYEGEGGSTVIIHNGDRLKHIAETLENAGIIKNRYLFMALARYRGYNRKIQAGEYLFSERLTPETILQMLIKGKVKLHRITIPEGFNIKETAMQVERAGFGNHENFIRLASDAAFIHSLKVTSSSLEGYLFPDTYFFPAGTDQKKIIRSMVDRFWKVFTPEWRMQCEKDGFSIHDIVILASIIEKETGNAAERPVISSVFHNRLKKGMKLESDPTVIYGIADFNGNITKSNLLTVTPYNTYAINGLPAGPISNPGRMSLRAALFPGKSDYIFFVSKNDSTHYFSKTLDEHNRAVRKYQLHQ